jgi:hypothetical protein
MGAPSGQVSRAANVLDDGADPSRQVEANLERDIRINLGATATDALALGVTLASKEIKKGLQGARFQPLHMSGRNQAHAEDLENGSTVVEILARRVSRREESELRVRPLGSADAELDVGVPSLG